MRKSAILNGLTVNAFAGGNMLLLGLHLTKIKCKGSQEFSIRRKAHTENESYYVTFRWTGYSTKPDHTQTVTAIKGSPPTLIPLAVVNVKTKTEKIKPHNVHFNRGISATQEDMRSFVVNYQYNRVYDYPQRITIAKMRFYDKNQDSAGR